jgi:hypothetical protein
MKAVFFGLFATLLSYGIATAQVAINTDGTPPDNSAALDIKSTTLGFLPPRLTTDQRNAVPSPATGLILYNTTTNRYNYYNGTQWKEVAATKVSGPSTGTNCPAGGLSIYANSSPAPAGSAMLNVNDPSRGMLIPRLGPPSLVPSPVAGLLIFNTVVGGQLSFYSGSQWVSPCDKLTGTNGATGSQPAVGFAYSTSGNPSPDPSAILDVSSTSKGILIPRMTTAQRDFMLAFQGLTIYNTDAQEIEFYTGPEDPGTAWYRLSFSSPATPGAITGEAGLCPATLGSAYSISAVPSTDTYNWSVPTGWIILTGQGTNAITVTSGSAGQNGNVSVTAQNECGASLPSNLAVVVYSNPTVNVTPMNPSGCPGVTNMNGNPAGGTPTYTHLWTGTGSVKPYLNYNNIPNPVFSSNGECGDKVLTYKVTDSHGCSNTQTTTISSVDNTPPVFTNCPGNQIVNHDVGNCLGATVNAPVLAITTLPLAPQSTATGADPFQDERWQSFTANKTGFVTTIRFWDTLATTGGVIYYRGGGGICPPISVPYTFKIYTGEYLEAGTGPHSQYQFACIYGDLLYQKTDGIANGHLITINIPQTETPYIETGKKYTIYIGGVLWPILYGSSDDSWNTPTNGKYWDDANWTNYPYSTPNGCPGSIYQQWDGYGSLVRNYKLKYELYVSEDKFGFSVTDNCSMKTLTVDPPATHLYPPGSTTPVTYTATDLCGKTSTCGPFDIYVNPIQQPTISGPTPVSVGSGYVYTTETGKTNYSWSVSSGGTITAGNGTSSITVTWTASGPQSVNVNYQNSDGCTPASPTVFPVTVN